MNEKSFWYVIAHAKELTAGRVLAACVLDEHLVCFRGKDGAPVVMRDRCVHRCGKLSRGSVAEGVLTCPYHGWQYDDEGRVIFIPSEGGADAAAEKQLSGEVFEACEEDGYIYVRLDSEDESCEPFRLPHYGEQGWQTFRLVHTFENTVTNCVENFIDIPHTAFVHEGIFRKTKMQEITAEITQAKGTVSVEYANESDNLGSWSWFLNPHKEAVYHADHFYMPNVTHVVYRIGQRMEYLITSQSVPVGEWETQVFTDITYRFGIWNLPALPIMRRQARRVIRQDIDELKAQAEVIQHYDGTFNNSPADLIHFMVSQIRSKLAEGKDPRKLPDVTTKVTFWV